MRFSVAFLLAAAGLKAMTIKTVGGRLEEGSAGELVLTLNIDPVDLSALADKEGREGSFDIPALAELVRERFHYLLRLRVGGEEFAPTLVTLTLPHTVALPNFLPLTATWDGAGKREGDIVSQTDSPDFRLELTVVDRRVALRAAATLEQKSGPWFVLTVIVSIVGLAWAFRRLAVGRRSTP